MTIRVPLPGGNWAEVRTADDMTLADGDRYTEVVREIVRKRRGDTPAAEPQPDPADPAVMLPPAAPDVTLTDADLYQLRELAWGMIITAWSYDVPLPYTEACRVSLPLSAGPALVTAIDPVVDALNGNGPKETPDSGGTSASTSPDDADAPPTGPPSGS